MALNITDPSVHETVERIARITGESQAEVIAKAVDQCLARLQQDDLAARLLAIGHETATRMTPEARRLDYGAMLDDEEGLPS